MQLDLIVFDLDGTLIDSRVDIGRAVNTALQRYGLAPLPQTVIDAFVGNGVRELMRRSMNADRRQEGDHPELAAAIDFLLSTYYDGCLETTTLYPDVADTLAALQKRDLKMAVCTNKPIRHSEKILRGLEIHGLFEQVVGGDSFATKKPDPEGFNTILQTVGVPANRALMVGDSAVDVETGRRGNAATCGCTYGLRPRRELEEAHAACVLDNRADTCADAQTDAGANHHYLIDRFDQLLDILGEEN